ncbi:hypothetical protein PHMEG_00018535 [Phytophthora megakarya]|uniref:Reverse transcriptase/retrotransposon-derived protein RNase H-like domain-containing protein n=1 Tax=Phytophthora megakarya TaxID=4795 RepID=A0A225VVN2_9STRA|nr:hypothetical protein PHMEG_00018535 [Phytophthora megakarya]
MVLWSLAQVATNLYPDRSVLENRLGPRSEEKASDNGEGIKLCVPAPPSRGEDRADNDSTPGTEDLVTPGRSVSFEDTEYDHDAKDEDDYVDDELEDKAPVQEPDLHEDADVFVTKSGGVKSLSHNLADEFEEAGKPVPAHDELNDGLKNQVDEDTVFLGMEAHAYPSSTALADWTASEAGTELQRWKRKLKTAFGSKDVGIGRQPVARSVGERVNPATIPLPRTPKKTTRAVFGSAEQSPYFHDSHMVTPRSQSRKARVAREAEQAESTANARPGTGRSSSRRQTADDDSSSDEGNPFYQDDDENDTTTELAWQIRQLTAMEEMDPTPRFEIAQHRPLGTITPFRGKLGESENTMQWLRRFVYEMKGTHTPPNECLLSAKFISYYCSQFSQSASTRYYRAKRSEKEYIRDYLNRLNGYARSDNIKFERSGREAKGHVKHFSETCGDRDLERQLTPMQLHDIHTLEDIVSDIQKMEKRVLNRSPSQNPTSTRMMILLTSKKVMKLTKMGVTATAVQETRCKQVHDFGKCEAFDELVKTLRTNVDKKNISPELQKLVFADLVIDAECLYAFTGKCEWPEDNNNNENGKNGEFHGECGVCLDGGTLHEIKEDTTTKKVVNDDWLVRICEASEAAPMHAKTVNFLPGELNDVGTSNPLDTGANVSIITTKLARRLRLDSIQEHGRQLEVQGIQEGKMSTTTRVNPKVTLGCNTVYEFEFWVMDHSAGSEVMLGTDFMIPAGIRLDLFNATANLPGEEMVRLVKSLSADEDSAEGMHVTGGPTKSLQIPAGEWIEFRLQKRKPSLVTHDLWVRRTDALIPTITRFRKGQPTLVRLTNITNRVVYCPTHLDVIARKLDEYLSDGDDSLSQDEQWSIEPVARSVDSATDGSPVGNNPVSAAVALGASSPTSTESSDVNQECNNRPTEAHGEEKSPDAAVADLEHTFMCVMHVVMHVLSTEGNDVPTDDDYAVHEANYISPEDYARELAFLPDLTEPSVTELDYIAPNVNNPSFVGVQKRRLEEVLKKHESIMISSGNALPPPTYGVTKGLLKAGLVAFSDSPWASPIVIVLKKNGQDIRLCIDYKMVNAVTAIMEYAMPLVDDLLTEQENYLWFLFVGCRKWVLGNHDDDACEKDVSPKGGWERYAERIKLAEEAAKHQRSLDDDSDFTLTTTRTKFEADRQASSELDPVLRMMNDPYVDMFATDEPVETSLVPVFQRRSFVDDICFGGTTLDDCLDTLDKLLARFEECRISVSFTKSIFCLSKVDFLSHEESPEGIRADPKKMTAITKLPFPKSKKGMQQFLGSLNYYSRFIQHFASFAALQRKVADAPILRHFDAKKEVHIMLYANEWAFGATLIQMHDDKLHHVRFCGRVLKDAAMNYQGSQKEVLALLLLLKVCYTQLAGKALRVYTRFSTLGWVHKSKSLFGRAVLFAVLLSP